MPIPKHEFYLTDAVEIARGMKLQAVAVEDEEDDVRGINTKAQLAEAEAIAQQRLRKAALDAGVTLIAPETVFLSADTKFGKDVMVEPYVVFGEGDGRGRRGHPFVLASRRRPRRQGRFGRAVCAAAAGHALRRGRAHRQFRRDQGSDAGGRRQGQSSELYRRRPGRRPRNIGAGTITCNYDGAGKHRTEIGNDAFIGSNSALVAPVKIGDGAYVGSGSVITENVPADALALSRGRQVVKEGWAARLRALKSSPKRRPVRPIEPYPLRADPCRSIGTD